MKHCQQINFNFQLEDSYEQILIYPTDSIVEGRVGIDLNLLLARKQIGFGKIAICMSILQWIARIKRKWRISL